MVQHKFKAKQLFDGYHIRSNEYVLIVDGEGKILDLIPANEAGDNVPELDGILSPGFINCHCHLELSHMKAFIPQQTGLVKFVTEVVQQRHFPEEQILDAIANAEDDLINNGIVAVGDICNNLLTLSQKSKKRVLYHNFIEASGFVPSIAKQRFDRSSGFYYEYAKQFSRNSIVPHAPYSVSEELWDMIIEFPGNNLLTIHNQETAAENEWFNYKTGGLTDLYSTLKIDTEFFQPPGKSSLQSFLPRFKEDQSLILVHNVHTTAADIQFSKNSKPELSWCLCPNANLYISNQLPDIDLLMNENCQIVLGTDSLASNEQLSILSEIKTLHQHFPNLELVEMLSWGTINGAKALRMDSTLGSFEKGKSPGVVLISKDLTTIQRLI